MNTKALKRTAPYYSDRSGRTVYHQYLGCYEGRNIEDKYFATGQGNRRLCKSCAQGKDGIRIDPKPRRKKRTAPYHSLNSGVYHVYTYCFEGNNIEDKYFAPGKGSSKRKLCARCAKMKMSRRIRRAA